MHVLFRAAAISHESHRIESKTMQEHRLAWAVCLLLAAGKLYPRYNKRTFFDISSAHARVCTVAVRKTWPSTGSVKHYGTPLMHCFASLHPPHTLVGQVPML